MANVAKGDTVQWNTPQGKTEGTVTKKITSTQKTKGHTAKASKSAPQYEVKSKKTGKTAIHKATSLTKK